MLICVTLCHSVPEGAGDPVARGQVPRSYPKHGHKSWAEPRGYLGTIFADMTTEKHTLGTQKVIMTV